MITPMQKYAFLVHRADYEGFLERLRALGLVHLTGRRAQPSPQMEEAQQLLKRLAEARKRLAERAGALDSAAAPAPSSLPLPATGPAALAAAEDLTERLQGLQLRRKAIDNDIAQTEPWGNFSHDTVEALRAEGIHLRLFTCQEKQFDPAWLDSHRLTVVARRGPDVFFAVVQLAGEPLALAADEMPVPKQPVGALAARREALDARLAEVEAQLDALALGAADTLARYHREVMAQWQTAQAMVQSVEVAEGQAVWLKGFVPDTRAAEALAFCEAEGIPYLHERPRPSDQPPILLRNGRFTRLYEAIGELYSLPGYGELDLTPFFAPFFMLFFGFCLGDAGYGLVLIAAATVYKPRAKPALRPMLTLAQWLGLATVGFGILTGTFFGLDLLRGGPEWLHPLRGVMIDSNQTFNLALALGLVQILFGLALQTANKVRQYGWAYAVAPLAWMVLLLALVDMFTLELAGEAASYAAWAAAGAILLFSDPDAPLLVRLGKGVWQLYGITGFVGDLMSYIRLFALGISSAILGLVINDIALRMLHGVPVLGVVLFVFFLVVGHGANLLIAGLGAFVHPLRLTFVEFYKNAGFTGGGQAYAPFGEDKV